MKDNYKYRFKEPNFQFTDYYKEFINLYPEEFDQLSQEIKNLKKIERRSYVDASCMEAKQDYNECLEKVKFLSPFFCFQENHKYYECVSVNQEKFDRYLKYFIHNNKQSYLKYWENQEKIYYENQNQKSNQK